MRVVYEERTDVVTIYFLSERTQVTSELVDEDIILDFAEGGRLAAIEIIGASERLDLAVLKKLTYEVDTSPPIRMELPQR